MGCDTSVLGARLLLKEVHFEPMTNHMLAANGNKIPLLGELKVNFKVASHEHAVL